MECGRLPEPHHARGLERVADPVTAPWTGSTRRKRLGGAVRVLAEVDILADGSLDLDDGAMAGLDVVLVSAHSRFNMSKAEMTRRIVRAWQHPRVHILGHPTGRLIGKREGARPRTPTRRATVCRKLIEK